MMKRFKRFNLFLSLLMLFSSFASFGFTGKASAQSTSSLQVGYGLTGWVLDENAGYLYAITDSSSNKLLFIRLADMQVEKALPLSAAPTDIRLDSGSLYIPLSGTGQISVVDAVYQSVKQTFTAGGGRQPYHVAVDGNKLFYVGQDQWTSPYVIDMSTGADTLIGTYPSNSLYEPDLTVDKQSHLLFLGESGISGGNVTVFSTIDYSLQANQTNYQDGYGFSYPDRKVLLDGSDLFYAGRKLDEYHLATIHGDFRDEIVAVKDYFALSKTAVYDRDKFVKVADLPYSSDLVAMDSAHDVYLFNASTQSIDKITVTFSFGPVVARGVTDNELNLNAAVSDMVYDERTGQLMAVSGDANKLLYINGSDLSVNGETFIGSRPTDIDLFNNKLYVALYGSTKVAVSDTISGSPVSTLNLDSNPRRIEVDAAHVYYMPEYDESSGNRELRMYQFADGSSGKVSYSDSANRSYYKPDLYLDRSSGQLFLGETGLSTSYVYSFTPPAGTGTFTQNAKSSGYSYPTGNIAVDGSSLYYAGNQLDAVNLTQTGTFGSPVVYANTVTGVTYAFTSNSVYMNGAKAFDLPFTIDLATMTADGSVFLYSSAKNGIFKYSSVDEIKIPRVTASAVTFRDNDPTPGRLAGTITWQGASDESYVTGYMVRYLDQFGGNLGDIGEAAKSTSGYSLTIPPDKSAIPNGAVSIGVFAKNAYATSFRAASIHLWDDPYSIMGGRFIDGDAHRGTISGTVTWSAVSPENNIAGYKLYFIDANLNTLGSAFADINKSGLATYSYAIDASIVPASAVSITVFAKNQFGEDGPTGFIIRLADLTLADSMIAYPAVSIPAPTSLSFVDTDADAGQIAGDIMWARSSTDSSSTGFRVYWLDSTGNKIAPIGEIQRVLFGGYRIALPADTLIPQGAVKIGVYGENASGESTTGAIVTLTDLGGIPASDTTAPVSDTNSSGSGTTAAGDTSSGTASTDTSIGSTETSTDANGQSTLTVDVADSTVLKMIDDQLSTSDSDGTVLVPVTGSGDVIQTNLSAAIFSTLNQKTSTAQLNIQSENGSLVVPAAALLRSLESLNIQPEDASITISISKASTETAAGINRFFDSIGAQTLIAPIDFKIEVTTTNGSVTEISSFSSFIGHSISLPASVQDDPSAGYITGVMYDPASNSYFPIPTITKTVDGKLVAVLYRQGNSIYTVIKNQKTFADVPADFYAKKAIDVLASKLIITGYEDGTFGSDRTVTRAEFASLLTRALGIVPAKVSSKPFQDVSPDAWYAGSVAAAVKAGLIHGYDDGTFRPNATITRQEMAVMVQNALHYAGYADAADSNTKAAALNPFNDRGNIGSWAMDAASTVVRSGIIQGTSQAEFAPNQTADRGQSAAILYRMLQALHFAQ